MAQRLLFVSDMTKGEHAVRTREILAALVLCLSPACTGQLTGYTADEIEADAGIVETPDAATDDKAAAARAAFESDVLPLLESTCAGCHAAGTAVPFLTPDPDVYTSVKSWPNLVNLDNPAQSRLLTKGAHAGPAWQSEQADTILAWIELEVEAIKGEDPPTNERETTVFTPVDGLNAVDLTDIGLENTKVTFRLEKLSVGFYLSEIMVTGGTGGAHLVHPLFVPWVDGTPIPDPVDRFADIDMVVEEGDSAVIGGGTVVLVDVPAAAQLSIHFEVAEFANGGTGVLAGGCNNVAAFTTNAQPMLSSVCAAMCHGGTDSQAVAATDMTRIDEMTPEGQAAACGQILSRVNLLDPANSSIFLAPDPSLPVQHDYKFETTTAFEQFRTSLLNWINQE